MQIQIAKFPDDLDDIKKVSIDAFSETPDSDLSDWFSFDVMQKHIDENLGLCLKAVDDEDKVEGMIYAEQESVINGKESLEKWVVILAAVSSSATGKGIGSLLLKDMEQKAKERNVKKMFIFTNKDDDQVINFYKKNGYSDAGFITDYQYGKGNSAVFLLKYL